MVSILLLNPPSKYSKNVVRDLFYGCWCKGKRIASTQFPPTTLMYMMAVLEKEGHNTTIIDSQAEGLSLQTIKRKIAENKPEVIVIPTSTMSFVEDVQVLRELKAISNSKILAFGSHVTFMPKVSVSKSKSGIDYIVMKEPEYIIRDFANALRDKKDVTKIKGLGYLKKDKAIINQPYPFIANLNEMPIPSRKVIKHLAYFNPLIKKLPWTTAITSRGCPGRCTFCTSPSFYGNTWRTRDAQSVFDEMLYLKKEGFNEIFFRDETFTTDKKRVIELCNIIIKNKLDITWLCSARVNTVDKEMMVVMKKAGCHMLRFGVESGVQTILDNINKGIQAKMTVKIFKEAREVGMETHAHVMLGCTGETQKTAQKTIEFAKKLKPTTVTFGAFTPYPGTPLFDKVKLQAPEIEDGTACDLTRVHSTGYYSKYICDLTDKEVGKLVHAAYKAFYLRPSYILRTLLRIRSLTELRRVISAGLEVLSYASGKE